MGAFRAAVAAVLVLFTAVAAMGDCVTTARLISTRQSKPNLISGPVAWSGSVLGVAKTQEDAASALWFAVYDEALQTLIGDRLVATDSRDIVSLEWTGTDFGLFYRTTNQRLHLQRLTMMGEPIGGPIPITPGRTVYSGDEIDVEWSPVLDAYVIGRNISQGQFQGIWVTYVARDGTQRSDRRLPVQAAPQSNLSLSVTNAGVAGLVFANSGNGISLARVTEATTPISITVAQTAGNYIETAAVGNQFVITHALTSGGKLKVHWLVVDTSHQVIRPDEVLFEGAGDEVWPLALVATEEELAMAYISVKDRNEPLAKEYRLRRMGFDGTTITDNYFAASDLGAATRSESIYDFVWTGTSYLQASFRSSPDRLNSHLLRYCPLRARVTTDVAFSRPGQPVVFTALPDGGTPGYSFEWTFGDPARVFRAQTVSRTFDKAGTYTATVTVTDTAGSKYTATHTINVIDSPLRASILVDVPYGRPAQPILFTAVPEGGTPGYTYQWTFGDSTGLFVTQSVAHTYAQTGTYTATLKVTDSAGATFTTTQTVSVVNVKRRAARR